MDPEAFVILSVFLSCVCFLQNSKVAVSFLTVARRFFLTLTLRFDFFSLSGLSFLTDWFDFYLLTYLLTLLAYIYTYLLTYLFI